MPNLVLKLAMFFNLLGANGVGPATAEKDYSEVFSGISQFLSGVINFVAKLFETVYGWLVNLIWVVVKLLLNLVDCLYIFVQKLVGIDIYQNANWSELVSLEESDLIVKMLLSETVLDIFGKVALFSLILLFIFIIFSLIKSNYAAATSDSGSEFKVGDVFKKVAKSLFLFLIIPFILVVGILGSNVILSSALNAIKGSNDLSFGGMIFSASAYDANKYRIYAKEGVRIPITYAEVGEVVVPSNFQTESDMRGLFFKLANGDVLIKYVTEDAEFKEKKANGDFDWITYMDYNDAYNSDPNTFPKFDDQFNWWWNKYCDNKVLNDLGAFHSMINSIYDTNWKSSADISKKAYDWAETYKIAKRNLNFSPTNASVSIYENSENYQDYENFATLELEYFVMADFIDYAIQHYTEFYVVNSDNENIIWSDIVVDDELINIDEYSEEYAVFYDTQNGEYFTESGKDRILANTKGELLSQNSFYVSYYNGVNRLYWTEDGLNGNYAKSENSGATYIICVKNEAGQYIPVTQTTTSFSSNFLNSNYGGPIVARGLFSSEMFTLSGFDYERPSFINEVTIGVDGSSVMDNSSKPNHYLFKEGSESASIFSMSSYNGTIGDLFEYLSGTLSSSWIGLLGMSNNQFKDFYKNSSIEDIEGNKISVSDLYYDDDIAYYIVNNNGSLTLYDTEKNRIGITADSNNVETEIKPENYTRKAVNFAYVYDYEHGYSVISGVNDISDAIDEMSQAIKEFKSSTQGKNTNLIFDIDTSLVINYQAELLTINHNGQTVKLLVGAKPISMQEGTGAESGTTAGSFPLVDLQVGNFSLESIEGSMYKDAGLLGTLGGVINYENLYIKGGKIYSSDGKVFWEQSKTQNQVEFLPINLILLMNGKSFSFLYDTLKARLEAGGFGENDPLKDLIEKSYNRTEQVEQEDGTFEEVTIKYTEQQSFSAFLTNVENSDNAAKEQIVQELMKIYANLTYGDVCLGLSSKVQNLNEASYYALNTKVVAKDENGDKVVDKDEDGNNIYVRQNNLTILNSYSEELSELQNIKSELKSATISVPIFVYQRNDKENYIVFASVGTKATGYSGDIYTESQWELRCTARYTEYSGDSGVQNLGLVVSINELATPDGDVYKNAVYIKNGGIYYKKLNKDVLLISSDSLRQYVANSVVETGEVAGLVEGVSLVNKDLYDNDYIYFNRDDINNGFLFDFSGQILNMRVKLGYATHVKDSVTFRLQGGKFLLDYNFDEATGIRNVCLYDMGKLNPLILIFATGIVFSMLWSCVYGLVDRILKIVILFIMLPVTLSASTFDDNQRFGKWKDAMLENIFLAYTVLIMLNLYFALVPTIRTLTDGLVSWEDMPTAIRNMFATISIGGTNFLSSIKTIGSSLAGSISNGLTAVGNFVSTISTKGLLLEDVISTVGEDAGYSTVLAASFLNEIIYLLFFLVFTSLVKNSKDILGDLIYPGADLDKANEDAQKSVKGTITDYKNSVPGKVVNKAVDMGLGAARWGAQKAARVAGSGAMWAKHKFWDERRAAKKMNEETNSAFTTEYVPVEEDGSDITFTPPKTANVNTSDIKNAITNATNNVTINQTYNETPAPKRSSTGFVGGRGSTLPEDEVKEEKKSESSSNSGGQVVVYESSDDGSHISYSSSFSSGFTSDDIDDDSTSAEKSPLTRIENSIKGELKELSDVQSQAQKSYNEYISAREDLDKKEKELEKYRNEVYYVASNKYANKIISEEEFEKIKGQDLDKLEAVNKAKTTLAQKQKAYKEISEKFETQTKQLRVLSVKADDDNVLVSDAYDTGNIQISSDMKEKITNSSIKELNELLQKNKRDISIETEAQTKIIENEEECRQLEEKASEALNVAIAKFNSIKEKGLKEGMSEYDEAAKNLQEKSAEVAKASANRTVASVHSVQNVAKLKGMEKLDESIQKEIEKRANAVVSQYKAVTVLEIENRIKELESKKTKSDDEKFELENVKKALAEKTAGGFNESDTITTKSGEKVEADTQNLEALNKHHTTRPTEEVKGIKKVVNSVADVFTSTNKKVSEAEERLNKRIDKVVTTTAETIKTNSDNTNSRVEKVDQNANARINDTIQKTKTELRTRDADIVRTRQTAEAVQANQTALSNSVKDYSEKVNAELKRKASVPAVNAAYEKLTQDLKKDITAVAEQNKNTALEKLKDANKEKRKAFRKVPKRDDKK